jgi:homoserine O-acetyltransferase
MMTTNSENHAGKFPRYEGLVKKQVFSMPSYTTVGGKTIKELKVGWECYGQLNEAKDNVILIPHFYSANSHVAGKYSKGDVLPGYWDSIIGPGKAIDTDRFFVISVDSLVNMNSKDGITVTTGPASINPDTGKPYGLSFPIVTIRDFVRVQKALLDSLGIKKLVAAGGVSMGGLQSYEWAAAYPEMVERVFAVNATSSQQPSARVVLESWVAPIKVDQRWNNGNYYGGPEPIEGVANALYNVSIDALHPEYLAETYGYQWADPNRDPMASLENDFLSVQSIKAMSLLRAQNMVDANHMLYMTRANQLFVAGTPGSSVDAQLKNIKVKVLVVQARTDLLFTVEYAKKEVAQMNRNGTQATLVEMESGGGHLSGVTEVIKAGGAIQKFLMS